MKGNLVYQESGSEKALKGGISRESTLIQLFRGLSLKKSSFLDFQDFPGGQLCPKDILVKSRFKVDIVLVPLVHARFKFEKSSYLIFKEPNFALIFCFLSPFFFFVATNFS